MDKCVGFGRDLRPTKKKRKKKSVRVGHAVWNGTIKTRDKKNDDGKARWDLLPIEQIEKVVSVLTFGAKKYSDNGWKNIDRLSDRYYAAALRHIVAWRNGEVVDSESGEDHLAHAICCLLFVMYDNGGK